MFPLPNIWINLANNPEKKIYPVYREESVIIPQLVDYDTPGGGWTKIVLRGDLRVLSGV